MRCLQVMASLVAKSRLGAMSCWCCNRRGIMPSLASHHRHSQSETVQVLTDYLMPNVQAILRSVQTSDAASASAALREVRFSFRKIAMQ